MEANNHPAWRRARRTERDRDRLFGEEVKRRERNQNSRRIENKMDVRLCGYTRLVLYPKYTNGGSTALFDLFVR